MTFHNSKLSVLKEIYKKYQSLMVVLKQTVLA
jgi:hypothetical protein